MDHTISRPLDLALEDAKHQFLEARRRFLEAKRSYLGLKELACLYRVRGMRPPQKLDEIARLRDELRHGQQRALGLPDLPRLAVDDPESAAARSRLTQELNDTVLKLQQLKQRIQLREELLRHQRHALCLRRKAAAAQCHPDEKMRDNILQLQKLKELLQLRQERRLRQVRALRQLDLSRLAVDAARAVATHSNTACKNTADKSHVPNKRACRKHAHRKNACSHKARRQPNFNRTPHRHKCCGRRPTGFLGVQDAVVRGPPRTI